MNVFFLSAPYQLASALEAISHFDLDDNHLRVIETGHFSRNQLSAVIDPSDWRSVAFHDFRYLLVHKDFGRERPSNAAERLQEFGLTAWQAILRAKADRIAAGLGPLDVLVLGNYRRDYDCHMRHLANRLRFRRLILLDVGTDTWKVAEDRVVDHRAFGAAGAARQPMPSSSHARIKLRDKLLEWDTAGADSVTFFSAYDVAVVGSDMLVRNQYLRLRASIRRASPTDEVWYLGQPLLDQGYIGADDFQKLLLFVSRRYSSARLVYVPHPRESPRQLEIVNSVGMACRRFAIPIEQAISTGGRCPCGISSFFSSAIENCAVMAGDVMRIESIRIPSTMLLKAHEEVENVYREYCRRPDGAIRVVEFTHE